MPPPAVVKAYQDAATRKEYTSVAGDEELRQLIATFHKAHNGLDVHPDNVLVAPGSKILIFNILLAFEKADVLIPSPSWVSYAPQVKLAGHNLLRVESSFEDRWRLTPASIAKTLQGKQHGPSILIFNYPGNPDGLTYTQEELKNLASAAREHKLLVISDEIYGLLDHAMDHKSFSKLFSGKNDHHNRLVQMVWCWRLAFRSSIASSNYWFSKSASEQHIQLLNLLFEIGSETYSCAPNTGSGSCQSSLFQL